MAGRLTEYLEEGFLAHCPRGWTCRREGRVVAREAEEFLGYAPRADVLLAQEGGDRRIWVEFEVSRADPVANHAKFATAQHLGYLHPGDAFLSMVSAHVARGQGIPERLQNDTNISLACFNKISAYTTQTLTLTN